MHDNSINNLSCGQNHNELMTSMGNEVIDVEKFIKGICSFCLDFKNYAHDDDDNASRIPWSRLQHHLDTQPTSSTLGTDHTNRLFHKYGCEYPIHEICKRNPPAQVLASLLDKLGVDKPELLLNQDGQTPLHSALSSSSSGSCSDVEVIRQLFTPKVIEIADTKSDSTPLHTMCSNPKSVSGPLAQLIIDHADTTRPDASGRNGLHLIFRNADKGEISSKIVSMLLEKDQSVVRSKDSESRIPLRYLADTAFFFDNASSPDEKVDIHKNKEQAYVAFCVDAYMRHLQEDDCDYVFFNAVDKFPYWLRSHACMNRNFQLILEQKVVEPFLTAVVLCDFYFFVAVIASLWLVATNASYSEPVYITLLACGAYFFFREFIEILLYLAKGRLYRVISRGPLEQSMSVMTVCLFVVAIRLANEDEIDRTTYFLMAFTAGFAWAGVISLLRSVSMAFAIFWAGIFAVIPKILAYMATLALVMISFAQMLNIITIGTGVCNQGDDNLAFCTFEDSLLRLYTMSTGEVDEGDFYHTPAAIVLYVVYLYFVVILLTNILAYVIGSHVYNSNNQVRYFWLNQLEFIIAMEDLSSWGLGYYFRRLLNSGGDICSKWYTTLVSLFEDARRKSITNVFTGFQVALLQVVVLVIVAPLWLLIGAITFGYLWPPQVRALLFHKHPELLASAEDETSDLDSSSTTSNSGVSMDLATDQRLSRIESSIAAAEKTIERMEEKLDLLLQLVADAM